MIALQYQLGLSTNLPQLKSDPILGRSFVRDLSPLRVLLTVWDNILSRLSAMLGVGTMVSLIPPADLRANLKWRDTNRSAKSVCSFIHF
ncbi:MAG: hypothetical protein C0170_06855 [Hydrogenobaculum sp.]|nr:MAG: hypothetical protein C0170_06855 [Hydrogenobaculum sp.]